jgi:hypothetical protein
VDKRLAAIGYRKADAGAPDVLVHFHASVAQRIDLRDGESPQSCDDCRPFIYDAGTLVIDLVDAASGRLLWRGWSEGNVDGLIDSQPAMEAAIDEATVRIFQRFPQAPR